MQAKSADGVPISYRVTGSGDPTLVFVHGWCCDGGYWDPQTAHFSQRHRVVTIDLAGHGESGMERKNWTVAAFGEDVAAVVNALALKKMILIGHSMGGPVVVEAALRLSGRVAAIVGVDTFQDLNRKRMRGRPGEMLARLRDDFIGTSREIVRSMFVEKSDPELVARIVADMSGAPPAVGAAAVEAMGSHNLAEALARLGVPVYCICSDYQPFDLQAAEEHVPSFKLTLMSGVGHFVMLEDPATFNGLLQQIIDDLRS